MDGDKKNKVADWWKHKFVRYNSTPGLSNVVPFVTKALEAVLYYNDYQITCVAAERGWDTIPPYAGRVQVRCTLDLDDYRHDLQPTFRCPCDEKPPKNIGY